MKLSPKMFLFGLVAGLSSGLLGVGGGTVMVPMLVVAASFDQHRAHATSLAAGAFLAAAGAATYARAGEIELGAAALLAAGALVGAPLGARLMHRLSADRLKVAFGALLVIVAVVMVVG